MPCLVPRQTNLIFCSCQLLFPFRPSWGSFQKAETHILKRNVIFFYLSPINDHPLTWSAILSHFQCTRSLNLPISKREKCDDAPHDLSLFCCCRSITFSLEKMRKMQQRVHFCLLMALNLQQRSRRPYSTFSSARGKRLENGCCQS